MPGPFSYPRRPRDRANRGPLPGGGEHLLGAQGTNSSRKLSAKISEPYCADVAFHVADDLPAVDLTYHTAVIPDEAASCHSGRSAKTLIHDRT